MRSFLVVHVPLVVARIISSSFMAPDASGRDALGKQASKAGQPVDVNVGLASRTASVLADPTAAGVPALLAVRELASSGLLPESAKGVTQPQRGCALHGWQACRAV